MKIEHIAYHLPRKIVSNKDLTEEFLLPFDDSKIFRKTGIRSRHVAEKETTSQLATTVANKLFSESGFPKSKIDFLLLCTQSPDYYLPTTACIVQNQLGLPTTCGALDFNLGCSGFVYGLGLSKGLIVGSLAKNILLITVETYTKYIHPQDRSVRTIFGDAATATLIVDQEEDQREWEFIFGTDGGGAENLIVPAGGSARPRSEETACEVVDDQGNVRSLNHLYMNGPAVFNFTLETVPRAVTEILAKRNLQIRDIDFFVFHQANKFMLESLREKIGIPEERFYFNISETGNTVSSSIPIALTDALKEDRIRKGDKVMLVGFGVGYSWASCVIDW